MSNDIAKALKQKTDAMLRLQGQSQKPVVYENADGSYTAPEKSEYTAVLAQGKNIKITTSGNIKTIEAAMNLLKGDNITISAPDANGAVTITGTISGKGISIEDFTGKNGYVLTYDSVADKFILAAGGGAISQATETVLGGIKAKEKTTEASEIAIDPATGKLYGPSPDAAANGLPQGGTAGQIPAKIDGEDYNVAWINPPSGGVISSLLAHININPTIAQITIPATNPYIMTACNQLIFSLSEQRKIQVDGSFYILTSGTVDFSWDISNDDFATFRDLDAYVINTVEKYNNIVLRAIKTRFLPSSNFYNIPISSVLLDLPAGNWKMRLRKKSTGTGTLAEYPGFAMAKYL